MNDCCYYFTVEPLRTEYRDELDTKPLLAIPIDTPRGSVTVALLGKPNEIELIRIRVPDCQDDELTEWHLKLIQTLKEHALSVLRSCYEADVQLAHHTFWAYCKPEDPSGIRLAVRHGINPNFVIDTTNIKNVFINSYSAKEDLKLLSEGINPRSPIQFRYLSLYLLLERQFKVGKRWGEGFQRLISQFGPQWLELAVSNRQLGSYLHSLRDRCAHMRGRGKLVGVTMLSQKDALELEMVLPLMLEIARTAVNGAHSSKGFSIVSTARANRSSV